MICPHCRSGLCRRSHRRGLKERVISLFGVLPWRCRTCGARFFARKVALRLALRVHCPNCSNMAVERVRRDRVVGGWRVSLKRALRFPAYRCDGCRTRFFSIRNYQPVDPAVWEEPDAKPSPTPQPGDASPVYDPTVHGESVGPARKVDDNPA